jgi:RNA polymerase sigma-70 factor (ECF subfamily)
VTSVLASPPAPPAPIPVEHSAALGVPIDVSTEPLRLMYDEHAQALLAFAERFTTWVSAEDAVRGTFLRARRNLPRLEADPRPPRPGTFRWWAERGAQQVTAHGSPLVLVLRRGLIDARRADLGRPVSVEDALLDRAVDGATTGCSTGGAWIGHSAHPRYVLGEIYRDAPVSRVAADLGIPAEAVRSRLHYALRSVRDQLTDVPEIGMTRSEQRSSGGAVPRPRRLLPSGSSGALAPSLRAAGSAPRTSDPARVAS